jgi:hypothetical protein
VSSTISEISLSYVRDFSKLPSPTDIHRVRLSESFSVYRLPGHHASPNRKPGAKSRQNDAVAAVQLSLLVQFSQPKQMSAIHFPSIAAFCTITEDGQVQYYKKQGAINDS